MKISIAKLFLTALAAVSFTGLIISCKKDNAVVDKTCKVVFILNLTNAAGDTTFVTVNAGELVQNAPTPNRAGFQFDGWYTNSADANPDPTKNTAAPKFPGYDVSKQPIYLNNTILYARWK